MSEADPARMWQPIDDLDRLLYDVWCGALAASNGKDMQEEIHDCPACGDPHMSLDEAKYTEYQRAILEHSRKRLDEMIAKARGLHP